MHSLVFYSLFLLSLIRFSGMLVAIHYFIESRKSRYGLMSLGWFSLILASSIPLIAEVWTSFEVKAFFLVINALFAVLGCYFCVTGLIVEFIHIPTRTIALYPIIILLITLISSMIDYQFSIGINMILFFSTLLVIFSVPLVKKEEGKRILAASLRWYYLVIVVSIGMITVIIISFFSEGGYGLYNSQNVPWIIINYGVSIFAHIVVVILIVQLENNFIQNDKNALKDTYSHNLGNMAQVVYGNTKLLLMDENLTNSTRERLEIIKRRCDEASELIREIRKL